MYVEVAVEIPKHLTRAQKEVLEKFEEGSQKKNHPDSFNFLEKVKRFFKDDWGDEKVDIQSFFEILQADNPHPKTELDYVNHFTLLVAVVLSAQATDKGE